MTAPKMSRTRLWLTLAAAGLATVGVGEVIHQLQLTAPTASQEYIAPGTTAPQDANDPAITCTRRTSGGTTTPEGATIRLPDRPVRSSEVVNCPDVFDGREVEYRGEVVGDVLRRDGGAWLLVNDDAYALSVGPLPAHREFSGTNTGLAVWVDTATAATIEHTGGPARRGDVFRFTGTILRVDPADGGGLTLRASDVELLSRGGPVELPTHDGQTRVAIVAAIAALAVSVAERIRARTR